MQTNPVFILMTGAAITLGAAAAAVRAADIPADAAASLGREYPEATFTATSHETINGVGVVTVDVAYKSGEHATARLTDSGDYLVSEHPIARARLPMPIKELDRNLFKTMPADIDRYTSTQYLVDVENNGKKTRLIFDPVGRLRDVESGEVIQHGIAGAGARDTDPTVRNDIDDLIRWNYGKKAAITTCDAALGDDNEYIVCGRNAKGEPFNALADPNEVFISQIQIDPSALPAPDMDLLNGVFRADKIDAVYRERTDFFEFDQPVRASNSLQFILYADGTVHSVTDQELKAETDTLRAQKRH